jgi:hypothetical protein
LTYANEEALGPEGVAATSALKRKSLEVATSISIYLIAF